MNDHVHNRIIRETIYITQVNHHQVYSKLEPVIEAAKSSCYTDVLTNHIALLPKLPTSSSLVETIFCTKIFYLETNNRSYISGSNFLQKWEVNPLQNVLYYMCHTNVKHNIMSSKSNNF